MQDFGREVTIVDMKRHLQPRPITIVCFLTTIFFVAVFFSNTVFGEDTGTPKRLANAEPGDCSACHAGGKQVLPGDHVQTKTMKLEQCLACHPKDKNPITLKMPSSHAHMLTGVSCKTCHGEKPPYDKVEMKTCTTCHSIEKLASAPARGPFLPNPHNSHYGTEVECSLCHHQHKKSEYMCTQCHDFKNVTPSPMMPLGFPSKPTKENNSTPAKPDSSKETGAVP